MTINNGILECKVLCNTYDTVEEKTARIPSSFEWRDFAINMDDIIVVSRAYEEPEHRSIVALTHDEDSYITDVPYEEFVSEWKKYKSKNKILALN